MSLTRILVISTLAMFVAGCSARELRNFNALTTPAPGTCAGVGCFQYDGTDTCCDTNWICKGDGCEFMGLPEWRPTEQYWTVGGSQSSTPETRPRQPAKHDG